MQRRNVFIGLVLAAVAPSMALASLTLKTPAMRFQWTAQGEVFMRSSKGWVNSINLGPAIQILEIEERLGLVYLTARINRNQFTLYTSDGKHWFSAAERPIT